MAVQLTEQYCWEGDRQVLTREQHGIPGICVFGHSLTNRAFSPLETHVHPGCVELVVLLKGNQTYTVGGKTYPISGGNIFISFPGEEHSSGGEPQNVSEFYWVQVDLSCEKDFLYLAQEAGDILKKRLQSFSQRVLYCEESLRRYIADGFQNVASQNPCRREYGRSLLVSFLYGILLNERAGIMALSDEIAGTVSYIRQNIREELTLEELAQCAGLSLSRFKARFKKETGMTPREYINQLKIREAKKLLKEGRSVTEVALELGFNSSNYFAVLFKKITLYTPTEYQKRARASQTPASETPRKEG